MAVKRMRARSGRVRKRVRRPRTRLMRRIVRRPVTTRKRSAVPLSRPFKRARRSYSRRRRTVAARTVGGDYSKLRVSAGRPRRVGPRVTSALTVDYRIFRWQRVNRQDGTEPTIVVTGGNSTSSAVPLGQQVLSNTFGFDTSPVAPVHVYDLNCTHNFDDTASVCYQLAFDGTTSSPKWLPFGNPQKPDGTPAANSAWQIEYSTSANSVLRKPYISPRWYDVRLLCYGARRQPTTYEILVVRFKRDWLAPSVDNFSAVQPENTDEHHAFWQAMAKKLCFSDIMPAQSRIGAVQRFMRVIKRVQFTLPSADTTDADTAPPSKAVKLFVPDGRLLRYRPNADSFLGNVPTRIGSAAYQSSVPASGNELNVPIYEGSRTWLIVRASNTTAVTATAATVDDTPSYDVCIRKKEALDAH